MLDGEPPYTRPTAQAIIAKSFADPIPGVRRVRDTVPESLDAALKRALAKVPADRFATASEFAEALTLSQEPSAALHAPAAPVSTVLSEKDQPRALSQRERRHATILLSRLTGYAAMVEELDPQDLERTMSVARRAAEEVMNKHGGVVNRFVGDEMEALFGVPPTHEDDALRGVRAAMDWRATVAELSGELEQRTGCQPVTVLTVLHTGPLVIQATDTGEAQFEVVGSTMQVVSQLLTQAEADEILVSPESQRVVAPFFETEAVASLVLRDAGQTKIPYRVLSPTGLKTRLEAAELVGLSPFTGRHEELQTLTGCLDHVLGGQGELVTVVGEAGVGKSRLHYEFHRSLDKERVQLVESRCHSYRSNVPYLPLIEALKDCLQLWEGAPDANLADEVARRAREIDPRLEDFVPLYLHLLSIHSDSYPTPSHLKGEDLRFALFEGL